MKTHALEKLTGAVKNSYGFVHGKTKALGHVSYPSASRFAAMLVDLNLFVHPRLYVMDGIVAMEGNGPSSGDPVHMGVLLFSTDPVALDTVFASLVHVRPDLIPTNRLGAEYGLGIADTQRIDVVTPQGAISVEEAVSRFGNPSFRVDRSGSTTAAWTSLDSVTRAFARKPHINPAKCVKCGVCVDACPVDGKALAFSRGREHPPVYNYKRCIRCFCCQEVCPSHAIFARRGL
jgi:Pyruvate/2-oxoacid:ferredoxin oxidoreductase delta subunit